MKNLKPKFDLTLIIPAYNEELKIAGDITGAINYFKTNNLKAEVIVSTDGVTDNTNKIVKSLQKKYKNLKLIAKKPKIGKGASIKEGVSIARGEIIMFADAGLCVPYSDITKGLKLLRDSVDLAIGSRAMTKSNILLRQPLYRQLGSRIFSLIIHIVLGIPKSIKDTQCGFKLFQKDIAKTLFSNLSTKGFMFDIELILLAKKLNYKISSFPVTWTNDPDTKFDPFRGSFDNIKELVYIKLVRKL